MENFDLHYYGSLDSIEESCYNFQEYKVSGFDIFIQCSGRFGDVAPNLAIENPALFVKEGDMYQRYVIEGATVSTDKNGCLAIDEAMLSEICKKLQG